MSHPLAIAVTLLLGGTALSAAEPPSDFAVVELFTSEGCSSCPPADRLLIELARRREQGEAVYCLGYHVDYWNKLGWTDRFSSEAMTRRQAAYAKVLGLERIYTPQMIVNGTMEFVGSNKAVAEQAVNHALALRTAQLLKLTGVSVTDRKTVSVTYTAGADADELIVTAALVQRHADSRVTCGENEGRKLQHAGIVRAFRSVKIGEQLTGTFSLPLPTDVKPADLDVVGFLQHPQTAAIVAATMTAVAGP
jgi:hypothetical protein